MCADRDGPTPGPPPPCGMQNVLCRFRCQTSAPNWPGAVRPTMRVHVRAIHVNLAAMRVHDLADVANASFEHAVRGRIRDHQRGELVACFSAFAFKSATSMLPSFVARDDHDLHAGHVRRCRVGAVRGRGNQADVAMLFAARRVIRADDQQAGVFALRAGVRLQRNGREAGDIARASASSSSNIC